MGRTGPRRRSSGTGPLGAVGALAATRRRELGLTQHELSALTDVGERTVQALEAGKGTLRLDVVLKLLDGLGLAIVVVPRSRARQLDAPGAAVLDGAAMDRPDGW